MVGNNNITDKKTKPRPLLRMRPYYIFRNMIFYGHLRF